MTIAGLDVGGTKIAGAALASRDAAVPGWSVDDVLARSHRPHRIHGPEALLDALEAAVRDLDEQLAEAGHAPIEAVGLAIAAWMPRDRESITWAAHLGVRDFALRPALAERLGMPVTIHNDADGYLMGEAAMGAAADASSSLLLALGTGVGGAFVADGRPLIGAHGLAGELGHVTVDEAGPVCSCTARGCVEAFAGGNALARDAAAVPAAVALAPGGRPSAMHLERAARAGDARALEVLEGAGRAVAAGLRRLLPAFDPEVVVLGGRVMLQTADLLLPVIERELAAHAPLQGVPQPRRLELARLGDHAAAIGAAVLAAR
ncbi:ROK family protein [Agrococcus sp. TF02-05]|uniref:ROK family protein n=1 Tax=Agrococcus sp. TF02-05 TaxID=2815211 RepID=UPI001AA10154|nr:ROK family protein [Agrococcus sp. TF02-05]MBO1771102.1 ROK family protein [Agrococcus sp. TF02-05]